MSKGSSITPWTPLEIPEVRGLGYILVNFIQLGRFKDSGGRTFARVWVVRRVNVRSDIY